MSIDTTLAVLYAQSGLSSNVANAAQVAPQASLAMSRLLAAEMARQERQQVEKSEKSEKTGVAPDGNGAGRFGSRRRRRAQDSSESPQEASPLLGNLLNLKV